MCVCVCVCRGYPLTALGLLDAHLLVFAPLAGEDAGAAPVEDKHFLDVFDFTSVLMPFDVERNLDLIASQCGWRILSFSSETVCPVPLHSERGSHTAREPQIFSCAPQFRHTHAHTYIHTHTHTHLLCARTPLCRRTTTEQCQSVGPLDAPLYMYHRGRGTAGP